MAVHHPGVGLALVAVGCALLAAGLVVPLGDFLLVAGALALFTSRAESRQARPPSRPTPPVAPNDGEGAP